MTSPTNFPGAGRGEAQDVLRTVGDSRRRAGRARPRQGRAAGGTPAVTRTTVRSDPVSRRALWGRPFRVLAPRSAQAFRSSCPRRRGRQPYGTSAQFRTYDASRASARTGRGTAPPRACAESVAAGRSFGGGRLAAAG